MNLFAADPAVAAFDKEGWFDDAPDQTQQFFGVYATAPVAVVPGLSADLYFLGLDRNNAVLDAGGGE